MEEHIFIVDGINWKEILLFEIKSFCNVMYFCQSYNFDAELFLGKNNGD